MIRKRYTESPRRLNILYCLFYILAFALTSCNDFLTIEPQNEIVLEKYWTEEADVNSVLNACYAQLADRECITRMVVWGEVRSDNMTTGSNTPYALQQVFKENILETNNYTNWQSFYQCINRCNTVIYYAPIVNAKDPNFTDSEMRATIAEATTLRALCYFYLIRAFRSVPYITDPSNDDSQEYQVPATPFEEVLDKLVADVERVKDDAVRSYGEKSVENTCRITRWACYALLADLYLWKGEWQKCIDYCDLIIDHKIKEYERDYEESPTTMTAELYGRYPLISIAPNNGNYGSTAYNEIFGEGNSFESIFELNFVSDPSAPTNGTVGSFYGSNVQNQTRQIGVPTFLFDSEKIASGDDKYFKKTDFRCLENMTVSSNKVYIQKFVNQSVSFRTSTTTGGLPSVTPRTRDRDNANWIIYRLTDIMLMRAEAEVELAGNVEEGATLTEEQTQHYRNAFASVIAVWKRANNKRTSPTDTLKFDDYATSRMDMEDLVLNERQRELMFEGKRWFDLVRLSRREGDNTRMISKVLPKFQENASAIRIKLATQDILYWPYNREELKQNPYLKQNPAYETDETKQNF